MRLRSKLPIRVLRYSLLALCLLFAGGIGFLAIGEMNTVEADPLVDYRLPSH